MLDATPARQLFAEAARRLAVDIEIGGIARPSVFLGPPALWRTQRFPHRVGRGADGDGLFDDEAGGFGFHDVGCGGRCDDRKQNGGNCGAEHGAFPLRMEGDYRATSYPSLRRNRLPSSQPLPSSQRKLGSRATARSLCNLETPAFAGVTGKCFAGMMTICQEDEDRAQALSPYFPSSAAATAALT